MRTNNETKTLAEFLAERDICRVWWAGHGSPAGVEMVLNEDAADDDYCSEQDLLDLPFVQDGMDIPGEVSTDADGESRWDPVAPREKTLRDFNGNTINRLVVWAE